MIDFHARWIPSGLPGPAGSIMDSLDRAETVWFREGTASALLSLQ